METKFEISSRSVSGAHLPDIVEIPVGDGFLLRHLPDLIEHRVKLESECVQISSQPETLPGTWSSGR